MRPLPAPTLENLNPPVRGYDYFVHPRNTLDTERGVDSARNRWLLSEFALLAYEDATRIREVLSGAGQVQELVGERHRGFGFVAQFGNESVLAFRGTQAFRPGDPPQKFRAIARDFWTDARIERRRLSDESWVHGGFADSADELFRALQASGLTRTTRRWWICGHSLGGALAVLVAERLRALPDQHLRAVVTFGQPRVGNGAHRAQLEALPLRRVVHGCDVVPSLPPNGLGFVHASDEYVLAPERRANYALTVWNHVLGYWQRWRHGLGALTPVAVLDHAPLYYATHCYNEFESSETTE